MDPALAIFRAALRSADPGEAVRRHLRLAGGTLHAAGTRYVLSRYRRILIAGAGKAAAPMAAACQRLLGPRLAEGLVVVRDLPPRQLQRIEVLQAGHPVPDRRGAAAARRLAALASAASEGDLLIFLLSGGASALLPLPAAGLTLGDLRRTTQRMLAGGVTIHQMNTVRKHLSRLQGGQLARLAAPAQVLTLILSDVPGDHPGTIGSGPTAPDPSTYADALRVVAPLPGIPPRVLLHLERGARGGLAETPKPGDPLFAGVRNVIAGSNRLALAAAAAKAAALGYHPVVLTAELEGESREAARVWAAIAREHLRTNKKTCLLAGGETTVTLRGNGRGGRAQEFALAAALALAGVPGVHGLSAGTDGSDGPTTAAGAFYTGETGVLAGAAEALARNDSHSFFAAAGGLLTTGPTGTNVMDVHILLLHPQTSDQKRRSA